MFAGDVQLIFNSKSGRMEKHSFLRIGEQQLAKPLNHPLPITMISYTNVVYFVRSEISSEFSKVILFYTTAHQFFLKVCKHSLSSVNFHEL